jgi:hypothetical protein
VARPLVEGSVAEGRPALTLRDEDREQLEDLVAELLVAALEREGGEAVANATREGGG